MRQDRQMADEHNCRSSGGSIECVRMHEGEKRLAYLAFIRPTAYKPITDAAIASSHDQSAPKAGFEPLVALQILRYVGLWRRWRVRVPSLPPLPQSPKREGHDKRNRRDVIVTSPRDQAHTHTHTLAAVTDHICIEPIWQQRRKTKLHDLDEDMKIRTTCLSLHSLVPQCRVLCNASYC